MKNPCLKCPKVGCGSYHDICTEYQAFREWKDNQNRKKQEERDIRQLSRDHEMKYRRNLKQGFPNK